jgi:hypothetical protein
MVNMKSLKNKKTFTSFTSFTLVTLITSFTWSFCCKGNRGNFGPVTMIMCQPCGLEGQGNRGNRNYEKSDFQARFGKRAKITSVTLPSSLAAPDTLLSWILAEIMAWHNCKCYQSVAQGRENQ